MEILPDRAVVGNLIFKKGSNQNLVQSRYGHYLLDLGSEDRKLANYLKSGWIMDSQDFHDTYAIFDFSHSSGFEKQFLISWSEQHVEVKCDFTAPERIIINNNIAPGGTNRDIDNGWAVPDASDVLTGDFAYPGSYRQLYPATSGGWGTPFDAWLALWDEQADEVYGFTFSSDYNVQIGEDYYTTHCKFKIPAGSSTLAFHVRKPKTEPPHEAISALKAKPVFSFIKQVDQRFTGADAILTYTIECTNIGSGQATQTLIEDILPPELTYLDGTATSGGAYEPSTRTLSWDIGSLDAGGPAQQVSFQAQVNSRTVDLRPDNSLKVRVQASIDASGKVTWVFNSLDPYTGQPPEDPQAGFLPPITDSGYEIGWVTYRVKPKTNLATGARISNQSFVKFDVGPWKPAPPNPDSEIPGYGPWVNTIESGRPSSLIDALAEYQETPSFQMSWSGTDDAGGSGVRDYTIYVSDSGGQYQQWLSHTTSTSAMFEGIPGHTYRFYSIATDNVGNVEGAPNEPDAVTTIREQSSSTTLLQTVNYNFGDPPPGFNMDNFPIYRYWMNVQIENIGEGDAFNVTASISSWPPNAIIANCEGDVTVGDIPAGSSAWSTDTYTIELDLMQPGPGADQGITWRIEYDDSSGGHHIIENVPEFPPAPSLNRRAQWFLVVPKPKLYQNYPNPWNPETWIPYQIASPSDVRIRIYNLKGQLVKTLDLGSQLPGFYLGKAKAAYWNGRNEAGETVSSGIYFYQIQAGKFNAIKKMVILK